MGKNLQRPYITNYNLLTVQNLWQAHCQILLIPLLREFIKLSANADIKMIYMNEQCHKRCL